MSHVTKVPIPRSFGVLLDEPEFAPPTARPHVALATVAPATLFVEGSLYYLPNDPYRHALIEGHWRRGTGKRAKLMPYDTLEDLADRLNWSQETTQAFAKRVHTTLTRHT